MKRTTQPGRSAMSVRLEREGRVGLIVLDHPPANSYDIGLLQEFSGAVDEVRLDEEIGAVVVVSGLDKFFSVGADVGVFKASSPRHRAMTALIAHETFRKMEATPLIFVAAIGGHCLGGGLELALACDLRFAAEGDYQLGLPEVRLGLFPGSGGTQRLPRAVGLSRGIDLIARAATLSPAEALEQGLVDRLFPTFEDCRQAAIEYAARVADGAHEAIGRAKVSASLGYGGPLDLGLALEREAIAGIFRSKDAEEGIAAFLEKRDPKFKGD